MDTAPYRQALEAQPLDFTEWETGRLREHIGVLIVASEFANQRKYPEVEREIRMANFELCRRRDDYQRLQERLQATGHIAIKEEVTC